MNHAERLAKAHATKRLRQAEHDAMVHPFLEAHIAAGLGMYDIARALDARGVKPRKASSWVDNRRSLYLMMRRLGIKAPDTRFGRRRYLGNEQRDAEIVRLLRAGVLQRETARRVDVSVGTVRYIKRRDMPNEGARHG